MRRKIKNVFAVADYYCFACSPHNPIGLQLNFFETEEGVEAEWNPKQYYEGYPGVVHGGIQAVILDEIAAWAIYIKAKTSGVTSRLNVKYKKPVISSQEKIKAVGKIRNIQRSFCYVDTWLYGEDGTLLAEAEAIYFIYPQQKAIEMNWYPEDYNSFFDEA
ncbi:PaaI family thioesterase [Bacteroidales bacterium OttesenSCG-928-B11]|nr:PaaI family thioesterase [Bacteroidales bacterium OttesenSCG-928-E04]MDL2308934.1 PaaI family thioesterase [Bacteroidales bacterium OttesenSCG-928-C03]MDL2312705.1 PaaI family thioesterase [Bacteroidales bacterium OttesenSCG-928-B11]MDL2326265.1 PaaI family thioesterase [Bacteroidales bacterium OttesenSCG-928-A14]